MTDQHSEISTGATKNTIKSYDFLTAIELCKKYNLNINVIRHRSNSLYGIIESIDSGCFCKKNFITLSDEEILTSILNNEPDTAIGYCRVCPFNEYDVNIGDIITFKDLIENDHSKSQIMCVKWRLVEERHGSRRVELRTKKGIKEIKEKMKEIADKIKIFKDIPL